jgi:hypothetical protein
LLVFLVTRTKTAAGWRQSLVIGGIGALAALALILPFALISDYLRFDPKLPTLTPIFLCANLFLHVSQKKFFSRGHPRTITPVAGAPGYFTTNRDNAAWAACAGIFCHTHHGLISGLCGGCPSRVCV